MQSFHTYLLFTFAIYLGALASGTSREGMEGPEVAIIQDTQGIALARSILEERWHPLVSGMHVQPGDWIKTPGRGSNAVRIRLSNNRSLILGPGSLVEWPVQEDAKKGMALKLIAGEMEVKGNEKHPLIVLGPDKKRQSIRSAKIIHEKEGTLTFTKTTPTWLRYFNNTGVTEAMGSLLATIDGRNLPLTIGYHKVTVDIHNQIARTVIEESFLNHTDSQLEGIFHFPLPAGASISDFGMWIKNEYVEADVVEKIRARTIFETILREKRDPGLLEWSGGNLFKARIFPIAAHSEKRIKITYTQVLPLKNGRCRYHYALQSELLKQHPLKQLDIQVNIHDSRILRTATCTTHTCRTSRTDHAAKFSFHANKFTPDRNFEIEFSVAPEKNDLQFITHRRGDNGYFLLMFTPGRTPTTTTPNVANEKKHPLHVLILADTSGSMHAKQRKRRDAFVTSLLESLSTNDFFNLALSDVETDWVFPEPRKATAKNITQACLALTKRASLGWSDLDKAFAQAYLQNKKRPANEHNHTHLIYIGDGVLTSGDGDFASFNSWLKKLHQSTALQQRPIVHAVATGNLFEDSIMKTMARLNLGSFRRISEQHSASQVAAQWLKEVTRPGIRDITISFEGIQTARVFPRNLPNLTNGQQQIILGRYLPQSKNKETSTPTLKKGTVIVLGTENGKSVTLKQSITLDENSSSNNFIPRLWARYYLDNLLSHGREQEVKDEVISLSENYRIMTPYTSFLILESDEDRQRFNKKRRFQMSDGQQFFAQGRQKANWDLKQKYMKQAKTWRTGLKKKITQSIDQMRRQTEALSPNTSQTGDAYALNISNETTRAQNNSPKTTAFPPLFGPMPYEAFEPWLGPLDHQAPTTTNSTSLDVFAPILSSESVNYCLDIVDSYFSKTGSFEEELNKNLLPKSQFEFTRSHWNQVNQHPLSSVYQIQSLFPSVSKASTWTSGEQTWPQEIRDLTTSLLRMKAIKEFNGGLSIHKKTTTKQPSQPQPASASEDYLISATSWLRRAGGGDTQNIVTWCDSKTTGAWSKTFNLSRYRAANPTEASQPLIFLNDYSFSNLQDQYAAYRPSLKILKNGQTKLTLTSSFSTQYTLTFFIDTQRNVIVKSETHSRGKRTTSTVFSNFIKKANSWWATRMETRNSQTNYLAIHELTINECTPETFATHWATQLKDSKQAFSIPETMPSLAASQRALQARNAKPIHHLTLLAHFLKAKDKSNARLQLKHLKKRQPNHSGINWIEMAALQVARNQQELHQHLLVKAKALAQGELPDPWYLAYHLYAITSSVLSSNQRLAIFKTLHPVYQRAGTPVDKYLQFQQTHCNLLTQCSLEQEALALRKTLARAHPDNAQIQISYVRQLNAMGFEKNARDWIFQVINRKQAWLPHQEQSLRTKYIDLLEKEGLYTLAQDHLKIWIAKNPAISAPYNRYLASLIRNNEKDQAAILQKQWFHDGINALKVNQFAESTPESARLEAAIQTAMGRGFLQYTSHSNSSRIDKRWQNQLAQLALLFSDHKTEPYYITQISSRASFWESSAAKKMLTQCLSQLMHRIQIDSSTSKDANEKPLSANAVYRRAKWVWIHHTKTPIDWAAIAQAIKARWKAEQNHANRDTFASALIPILRAKVPPNNCVSFLKQQWSTSNLKYRGRYAQKLLGELLEQPWRAENEALALKLALDEPFPPPSGISKAKRPGVKAALRVFTLYVTNNRLIQAHAKALQQETNTPKTQPRMAFQRMQRKQKLQAITHIIKSLKTAYERKASKRVKPSAVDIRWWIQVEQFWLEASQNLRHDKIFTIVLKQINEAPPEEQDPAISTLAQALLKRRIGLLEYLVVQADKTTANAREQKFLSVLNGKLKAEPKEALWKESLGRILVAKDRSEELTVSIKQWLETEKSTGANARWQKPLAYMLAEDGHIKEAVAHLEKLNEINELNYKDYHALANWYHFLGQKDNHRKILQKAYIQLSEQTLQQKIQQIVGPWKKANRKSPTALNPEIFMLFEAIFKKSSYPRQQIYLLANLYRTSQDFRLLTSLACGCLGLSTKDTYPFLQDAHNLIATVRNQATIDQLLKSIADLQKSAQSTLDQRALHLLSARCALQATTMDHQAGPYIEKTLTAMRLSFKGSWDVGERKLLAQLLQTPKVTKHPSLAEELIRQLKALQTGEKEGTLDRLHIARTYARILWQYQKNNDAIDVLRKEIQAFIAASNSTLPSSARYHFDTLIRYCEKANRHALGEKLLQSVLKHPTNTKQKHWLESRCYQLYIHALKNNGSVSLGSGQKLYKTVSTQLIAALDSGQRRRSEINKLLCDTYETAHRAGIKTAKNDIQSYAAKKFPVILKEQTRTYQSMVNTLAKALKGVCGTREGLAFLIERLENEPASLQIQGQGGWTKHEYYISDWRLQTPNLGALEPRLLKIVLKALRKDMTSRINSGRNMYKKSTRFFWKEKEESFAKLARSLLNEHAKSGPIVSHISAYLYRDLNLKTEGTDALYAAYQNNLLNADSWERLAAFLEEQEQLIKAAAVIKRMILKSPLQISSRTRLMKVQFKNKNQIGLLETIQAAEKEFKKSKRWNLATISKLAQASFDCEQFQKAVAFYREVIILHQRKPLNVTPTRNERSRYYTQLAKAHAALQQFQSAVDAATEAIVTLPANHRNRQEAIQALVMILSQSKDLDAFSSMTEKKLAESGQENPILRKALAQAWYTKRQFKQALFHAKKAVANHPSDKEAHAFLIQILDELKQREHVIEALRNQIEAEPGNLNLYQDLARRLEILGRSKEADRARTSLVEARPNEGASHAMLGTLFDYKERRAEGIVQWKQVTRLRPREPNGFINLLTSQIKLKRFLQARVTLQILKERKWPKRFGNVPGQAAALEKQLDANENRKTK